MTERLRKEILSLKRRLRYESKNRTGRTRRARLAATMRLKARRAHRMDAAGALQSRLGRTEKPRAHPDVVDQMLGGLRRTMQGAEENWVNPVATAYWETGQSPVTRHGHPSSLKPTTLYRVRWMLKGRDSGQRVRTVAVLNELAALTASRTELKTRLAQLQNDSDKVVADAAKDLDLTLTDIPDSTLSIDWPHLCLEMAR
jgi:hypothetical protein